MLPNDLLKASGFISPQTQEVIKLTLSEKVIYAKIKSRNDMFIDHRDSLRGLAKMIHIDYRMVMKAVQKFEKEGVFVIDKKLSRGLYNNHYVLINDLQLVED